MSTGKTWRTYCQVRSNGLVLYDLPDEGYIVPAWRKPPDRKGYSGEVTASTRKRILTAVDVLLQKSPKRLIFNPVTNKRQQFHLSFITLTISQSEEVPATIGHDALKVFLQHFKRPWSKRKLSEPISSYLWKAELQSRGQLHYHLTANRFLHFAEVRRVWNDLQRSRGWLDCFHAKYGHWDPNSTDVHSVYKVRDLSRYLSKYIAKQEYRPSPTCADAGFPALLEPVRLDAKVWGCSEDLKGAKRFSVPLDGVTHENILQSVEQGGAKLRNTERCRFFSMSNPTDLLSSLLYQHYQQWNT